MRAADDLAAVGAHHLPGLIDADACAQMAPLFDRLGERRPGERLPVAALAGMRALARVRSAIVPLLGDAARPVRALLLDKRVGANWALGWHQDRTIEVAARADAQGFGPWTVKAGRVHVAPPFALLARMITVRVHLDPVDADNAPLLVAPGSHRLGLLREDAIDAAVAACGVVACHAGAGDVWLYATPILHASARQARPTRRRVLQIDFSAEDLPPPLAWAA